MAKIYKIHPAIGVARVGNSTAAGSEGFFFGPMISGAPPVGPFRDSQGGIKRQAAHFRVFEYDSANAADEGKEVTVGKQGLERIEWTVHLANQKAYWYKFNGLAGERGSGGGPDGYPPGHPKRNASIKGKAERVKRLIIDPGPRQVSGKAQAKEFRKNTSVDYPETFPEPVDGLSIDTLGEIRTDAEGNLLVLGGYGASIGPAQPAGGWNFANNDGWFDDTSDGPVTAKLVFEGNREVPVDGAAWVLVGPPDFAPGIHSIVSMYDLLYDLALRFFKFNTAVYDRGKYQAKYQPSFFEEIYPILQRAVDYRWVNKAAAAHQGVLTRPELAVPPKPGGTDPHKQLRTNIFEFLRDPYDPERSDPLNPLKLTMPQLHGDEGVETFLTLTFTQYEMMRKWAAGTFVKQGDAPPAPGDKITARGLDRAALESCVGGAFYPGIEAGWILRDERVYAEPFRFAHYDKKRTPLGLRPGDVTKRSALPWQADFLDCNTFWWPAQRPNQVLPKGGSTPDDWARKIAGEYHMARAWKYLGIVVDVGAAGSPRFEETGRDEAKIVALSMPSRLGNPTDHG